MASLLSSVGGAAAIGAGGDLLGSVASGLFNAKQASENRDFQAYMSDTALFSRCR